MNSEYIVSRLCGNSLFLAVTMGLALLIPVIGSSQIVINEVMADNDSAFAAFPDLDPDYFPDYVELYNTSASDIDLGAGVWSLSTKRSPNPFDPLDFFHFPVNTIIEADSYLLVYFDNKTNFPGVHTGSEFTLKASGDEVLLFNANKFASVNSVFFGPQIPNFSIGRVPDFTGAFTLTVPTPCGGAAPCLANSAVSYAPAPTGSNGLTLKINEWLAFSVSGGLTNSDWFEIYNPDTNIVSLEGLVFVDRGYDADDLNQPENRMPALSFIAPFGFVQIFADDKGNDADTVKFSLSSSGVNGDIIYMFNQSTLIDKVILPTFPTANISRGRVPDGGDTIIHFLKPSPEESNFGPLTEVAISEILTHTDAPLMDAVELQNVTNVAINIGGWWLSNNRNDPKKMQIPAGTILPPGGFKVFYETQFNTGPKAFTFNSANGDECYLFTGSNGNLTGFRRGVDFGPAENGVSFGRYITSDGDTETVAMSHRTFGVDNPSTTNQFLQGNGKANAYPKVGPIVINEIHYHPPEIISGNSTNDNVRDEFIELRNITQNTVLLYDPIIYRQSSTGPVYADGHTNTWRIRGEVDFDFPADDASLAAGGHLLVVNFDPTTNATYTAEWRTRFTPPVPNAVALYGPYKGKLSNGGASVGLHKPDAPQGPEHPDFGLVPYVLVDRVNYSDKAPWPTSADGSGTSLQRVAADEYGNDPMNWRADNPTAGQLNSELISDITRPTVTFTSPAANARLTTPIVTVTGTAFDKIGLDRVEYQLGSSPFVVATGTTTWEAEISPTPGPHWFRSSPFVAATGTTTWEAEISPTPGTNVVRVRSVDTAGNLSLTNQRSFVYVVTAPLVLSTTGNGAVAGAVDGQQLEIGRSYTLTATPAAGFVFSNWTGSVSSNSPKLTFTMETGTTITANFIANPFSGVIGKFNGLFWDQFNGAEHGSSGFFTLTTTERGSYTASFVADGGKFSTSGQLDLEGRATNNVARRGMSPLTVTWFVQLDGSDQVTGTVSDGVWSAGLQGDRAIFSARTNPYTNAGKYTFVLPGTPELTTMPGGDSYGTVSVDANGRVALKCFLSDKTVAVQKVPLSKNGEWPLYVPLYAGKGSLISWVTFTTEGTSDFSGDLTWSKPTASNAKYYSSGFIYSHPITGSRYSALVGSTNRILKLTEAEVVFSGGNLSQSYTNEVIVGPSSRVTNNTPALRLSFTFILPTGLFKGNFTPPGAAKAVPFGGAVLQSATNASGYFLGTNQSGRISLTVPSP
jgi:hypothetical protein